MRDISMRIFVRKIFMLALVAMSAGAQASVQTGIDAYGAENFPAALKELKPLAEKGDAKALYMLGIMYENGQGVKQDYEQALSLFNKSSEQGYDQAMLHLAEMYKSGRGTQVDLVQAHKWFNLAGSRGNEFARHSMETVEARLTPQQVEQAKTQAKEWLAKHKKK